MKIEGENSRHLTPLKFSPGLLFLLFGFNAEKTQLVSFGWSKNSGAIDVKMGGSVLEEKSFLRCWHWLIIYFHFIFC